MRFAVAAGLGVVLLGCATAPLSYTSSVPPGVPDAFDCAKQELAPMGYSVAFEDRDAGFIRAARQTPGAESVRAEVLTVLAFTDPATEERKLRVTASRVREQIVAGASPADLAPSNESIQEAEVILASCAGGETEPADP